MTTQSQQASLRSEGDLKALEKCLAALLGWEEQPLLPGKLYHQWKRPNGTLRDGTHPRWTGDDAAAFGLMVEHGLSVYVDIHPEGCDCVEVEITGDMIIENFWEHESKAAAVRAAIVRAVIAKLEAEHGKDN